MATWTARAICTLFGVLTVIVGVSYFWNPTVLPHNDAWALFVIGSGVVVLAAAAWLDRLWLRALSGALLIGAFSARMLALLAAFVLTDLDGPDRARAVGGACVWLMTIVSVHLVWRWGVIPAGEAVKWERQSSSQRHPTKPSVPPSP